MRIPEEVKFLEIEMGVVVVEDKLHVIETRLFHADVLIFGTDKSFAVGKNDDKQMFEVEKIILDL